MPRKKKVVEVLGGPSEATAKQSSARRFILVRNEDISGTSGTGVVAEGVQFSNGQIALHWLSQLEAINIYGSILVCERLHSHNGATIIVWIDDDKVD